MAASTRAVISKCCTLFLALFLWVPTATSQQAPVLFKDVTTQVGIDAININPADPGKSGDWGFITVADYDLDGWDDVLLNTHPGTKLYRNNGNGTFGLKPSPFPPVIVDVTDHRHIFLSCDFDGDGYDDIIIGTGFDMPTRVNLWMRNNRDWTFTDVAGTLGTKDPGANDYAMTCADVDNDGRLDVISNLADMPSLGRVPTQRLWMNLGSVFSQQAQERGLTAGTGAGRPWAIQCADFNRTGFVDCAESGNNMARWLLNTGAGVFRQITGVYEPISDLSPYTHDAEWADFTGDGLLDAAIVDTFGGAGTPVLTIRCNNGSQEMRVNRADGLRDWRNPGWETCWKTSILQGINFAGEVRSLAVGDFDNDGSPDMFLTHNGGILIDASSAKGPDYLFMNNGSGQFTEMAEVAGILGPIRTRLGGGGAAIIDYDRDGRLDIVLGYNALYSPGPFKVYRNVTPNGNAWVGFLLRAPLTLGSWVEVTACGRQQVQQLSARTGWLAQDSRTIHFGLGKCTGLVAVTVRWPGGQQTQASVAPGAYYTLKPSGPAPGPAPGPTPTPTPLPNPTPSPHGAH